MKRTYADILGEFYNQVEELEDARRYGVREKDIRKLYTPPKRRFKKKWLDE